MLEGVLVVWPWLGRQPEMRMLRWAAGWLRWASMLVCSAQIVGHWLASDEGLGQGPKMLAGIGFLSEEIACRTDGRFGLGTCSTCRCKKETSLSSGRRSSCYDGWKEHNHGGAVALPETDDDR